jgi:hypothetical protein
MKKKRFAEEQIIRILNEAEKCKRSLEKGIYAALFVSST